MTLNRTTKKRVIEPRKPAFKSDMGTDKRITAIEGQR
jgi:hypothetical protein